MIKLTPKLSKNKINIYLNSFIVLTLLSLSLGVQAAKQRYEYTIEDNVYVLDSNTLEQALDEFDHIFIDFYAPWCDHCKALEPKFKALAKIFTESGSTIKFGKLDCEKYHKLADQFNVRFKNRTIN